MARAAARFDSRRFCSGLADFARLSPVGGIFFPLNSGRNGRTEKTVPLFASALRWHVMQSKIKLSSVSLPPYFALTMW